MSEKSATLAALMYHNIGEPVPDECEGLTVFPGAFARQMMALGAMGYTTIRTTEWAAHVKRKESIPSGAVMITFDDACASLVDNAFPTLLKHGYSAIVFVPTSLIGKDIACNPASPTARLPIMSEDQIREWAERGIEFGVHSDDHVDLTRISLDAATRQMERSRNELSRIIGRDVESFAYPYGGWNEELCARAADFFQTAFTINEGVNEVATPLHALRRTMVQHNDTVADVCLRARYGRSAIEKLRTVLRRSLP